MDGGKHSLVRFAHPIVSEPSLHGRERVSRIGGRLSRECVTSKPAGLGQEHLCNEAVRRTLGCSGGLTMPLES